MHSIIPRVLFDCGQTTFFHTLKDTYLINAADILLQRKPQYRNSEQFSVLEMLAII
jgi:hypothetical protein